MVASVSSNCFVDGATLAKAKYRVKRLLNYLAIKKPALGGQGYLYLLGAFKLVVFAVLTHIITAHKIDEPLGCP
jgi:hypothetical protein